MLQLIFTVCLSLPSMAAENFNQNYHGFKNTLQSTLRLEASVAEGIPESQVDLEEISIYFDYKTEEDMYLTAWEFYKTQFSNRYELFKKLSELGRLENKTQAMAAFQGLRLKLNGSGDYFLLAHLFNRSNFGEYFFYRGSETVRKMINEWRSTLVQMNWDNFLQMSDPFSRDLVIDSGFGIGQLDSKIKEALYRKFSDLYYRNPTHKALSWAGAQVLEELTADPSIPEETQGKLIRFLSDVGVENQKFENLIIEKIDHDSFWVIEAATLAGSRLNSLCEPCLDKTIHRIHDQRGSARVYFHILEEVLPQYLFSYPATHHLIFDRVRIDNAYLIMAYGVAKTSDPAIINYLLKLAEGTERSANWAHFSLGMIKAVPQKLEYHLALVENIFSEEPIRNASRDQLKLYYGHISGFNDLINAATMENQEAIREIVRTHFQSTGA